MSSVENTETTESHVPAKREQDEKFFYALAAALVGLPAVAALVFGYGGLIIVAVFYTFAMMGGLIYISRG